MIRRRSIDVPIRSLPFLLLAFLVIPPLLAQPSRPTSPPKPKLNVAVLDFDTRGGLTRDEAATLSDAFQTEIVRTGEFTVVDRARIKQILTEQGFQQSEACSQVECIVEAGKILKVERMFAGTIGKVGSLYNVTIQVIDIASAQITQTSNRQHRGDIEDLLSEFIPEMAKEMIAQMTGRTYEPSGGGGWLWYAAGAVVLGGGAAAAILLKPAKDDPVVPERLPTPPALPLQ
jgi:TolB-like protein